MASDNAAREASPFGAYGASMASNYNSRPLPAEVLVVDGEARLVRQRQTLEELLAGEVEARSRTRRGVDGAEWTRRD